MIPKVSQSEWFAIVVVAGLILVPLAIAPTPCISDIVGNPSAHYCQQQDWKRIIVDTRPIEWLTLFVLVGQWMVFGRQAGIAERQNDISARQTAIAEQAMTIGQWPFLFVDFHEFTRPKDFRPELHVPVFEYNVRVHGNSPAILRRVFERLVFEVNVPRGPDNADLGWDIVDASRMPGESWTGDARFLGNRAVFNAADAEERRFFAIVAFVYDDVFGHQHEMRFCYVTGRQGGPGVIHGGPTYNYHRKREVWEQI